MMAKKPKPIFRTDDLQELWRCEGARADVPMDASWCHEPAPDLIGPMTAPVALWFARGRPKSAWEVAAGERAELLAAIDHEREMARLDERQMSLAL